MLLRALIICLSFFISTANAVQSSEAQTVRDSGIAMYKQGYWIKSQPFLRIAAEAGDRDAQYYLGEALRLSKRYMTAEAQKWYEAAAEQGDVYAMLRLASSSDLCRTLETCTQDADYWQRRAYETALKRAEQGDASAMGEMYSVTGELSWLKKAAEAGSADDQDLLAHLYKEGEGWFFWPGARQEAVEKWFKAAAEGGHAPAMMQVAEICYAKGDLEGARIWLRRSTEAGYVRALYSYASYIAHEPDQLGYPYDPVKAYALFSLIAEIDSQDENDKEALRQLGSKLKPEQLNEAKVFAEEWKRTHPPLSHFDPRFGF